MGKGRVERVPNATLLNARLRLGLSQDDLVRACRAAGWASCERRTIQRYETGEVASPHYEPIRKLSEVLQVPCDELGFKARKAFDRQRNTSPEPGDGPDESGTEFNAPQLEGIDEMRRRTFALGMATAGLAVG